MTTIKTYCYVNFIRQREFVLYGSTIDKSALPDNSKWKAKKYTSGDSKCSASLEVIEACGTGIEMVIRLASMHYLIPIILVKSLDVHIQLVGSLFSSCSKLLLLLCGSSPLFTFSSIQIRSFNFINHLAHAVNTSTNFNHN